MVGLLALPVIAAILPWELEVLPAGQVMEQATPAVQSTVSLDEAATPEIASAEPGARAGHDRAGVFFEETGEAAGATNAAAGTAAPSSALGPLSVARLVVGLWLFGAALLLARMFLGAILVRRIVRLGTPLKSYRWLQLLHSTSEDMEVVAPVRLVRSGALPMPVTAGILRPVIVLPEGSEQWDEDRRRAVLMHELAHVSRLDLAFHLMSRVACAVYWFNPLVWFAARKLRTESERACDDLVLNAGTRASEYADHLLHIVRAAGRSRTPAMAVPMAQRSEFEGRLLAILEPGIKRHRITFARGLAITAGLALSTVPLAALGRATPETVTPAPSAPSESRIAPPPVATVVPEVEAGTPEAPVKPAKEAQGDKTDRTTIALEGPAPAPQRQDPRPDAVAALVNALDDPDRQVRLSALASLAEMNDVRAVPGAMQALTSDDPEMRRNAVYLLGEMGDRRALPGLLPLLDDPDRQVRRTAARALGEFQDSTAIAALSRALQTDSDPEVRKTSAWALGEIEDPRAIPALVQALQSDESAEVRATAAWALGEIQDASALDALGAAVRDENPDVRRQSIRAIGEIDDRRAVPVLVPLLDDGDPEVRKLAVWALSELEDPSTLDALGRATTDSNVEVRRMAFRGLGELEDPRGIDYLVVGLQDADPEIRARAAWALGEVADRRALEPLVAALSDENAEVRSQVVHALGHLEDGRAETGLVRALADQNDDVRVQAADALGEIDLSVAPPALIAALSDPSPEVRRVAAHSLGHIADPAATEALAVAVQDGNRDVRLTALEALGEMGTQQSVAVLIAAMDNEDPEVRRIAAQMLGRRGDR
jgi:HEAT repeat protein/beta-lactamase regulating signal transducer with metallopeptidase domain